VSQLGLTSLGQNLVGVLNAVLGAVNGLNVGLVALEHGIADHAVAVQVHGVIVLQQVLADHLALQMAGLGSVGAHEGNHVLVGVSAQNGALGAVFLDGAVE